MQLNLFDQVADLCMLTQQLINHNNTISLFTNACGLTSGRALFSRTERRTVATAKECWSEDTLGEWRKNTQVNYFMTCTMTQLLMMNHS